jgi:cyclic nucleotide gated channel, plant
MSRRSSAGGPSDGECYACMQPGVPAFHSTTCDQVHSPGWDANAGSSLVPVQGQAAGAAAAARHAARWLLGARAEPAEQARAALEPLDPAGPRRARWRWTRSSSTRFS